MGAVTDNVGKIYIFAGGYVGVNVPSYYSNEMDIFDTINKVWTVTYDSGLVKRDGHTATFLPDTGEIVYIGGHDHVAGLIDIINVCNILLYI